MRPVKIGVRHNDMIQIVEGLAADEMIVVLGQFMLYPGAQVMDLAKMAAAKAQGAASKAQGGESKDGKVETKATGPEKK